MSKILANLTTRQRITILVVAIAVGAGLYSMVQWKKEADFRPLFTGVSPEDAASIVQKLKESGAEYRLPEGGGSVLVPSARLAELRLTMASIGLPKSGRMGFELFDKVNLGATEFTEKVNYRRALEGELERTVMALAEVETARVHLTFPKDSVFLEAQQPAKASVLIRIKPGARLSRAECVRHHPPGGECGGRPFPRRGFPAGHERQSAEPPQARGLAGRDSAFRRGSRLPAPDRNRPDRQGQRHARSASRAGKIPRRRFGGVRFQRRRVERRDLRPGAQRHGHVAAYRRQYGCGSLHRRPGDCFDASAAHLASRRRFQQNHPHHRKHLLSIQPQRQKDSPAGGRTPQDVPVGPGGPGSHLGKRQEWVQACPDAADARKTESDSRPGSRHHRFLGGARRPVGDRDPSLRNHAPARTAGSSQCRGSRPNGDTHRRDCQFR